MRVIFKAITLIAAVSFCDFGSAAPGPSEDYTSLKSAVLDGKDIRMTLDLSECTIPGTATSGPPIRGSLRFDAYMIQNDQSIAFSMTHFTVRSDKTPVDEFLSFKVRPTGKVDAHTSFLNPTNYTVVYESAFDCAIGTGASFHW